MGTKTLVELVEDALDETGFTPPATIIANTDDTAKRLLRQCQRQGDSMAKNAPAFQVFVKEHTFPLVAGTQSYSLPADFRYILPTTQWDRARRRAMFGSITSMEWQYLKAFTTSFGLNWRFRIRNNAFEIEQDVTSADNGNTIAFEYIGKHWIIASGGTTATKDVFTVDTDFTVFDDELFTLGLVWRFRKTLGFEYGADQLEYAAELAKFTGRQYGPPVLNIGARREHGMPHYVNVPESDFG